MYYYICQVQTKRSLCLLQWSLRQTRRIRVIKSSCDSAERHDRRSLVPVEPELAVFHNLHDVIGTEVQGTDFQEQECKQTVARYDSGCLVFVKA